MHILLTYIYENCFKENNYKKTMLKKLKFHLQKKIISVTLLNNYSFKNTTLLNCSTILKDQSTKDQMLYFFQMMLVNKLLKIFSIHESHTFFQSSFTI